MGLNSLIPEVVMAVDSPVAVRILQQFIGWTLLRAAQRALLDDHSCWRRRSGFNYE